MNLTWRELATRADRIARAFEVRGFRRATTEASASPCADL
jgi:hypothetical protein